MSGQALQKNEETIEFPEKLGFLFDKHRYKICYGGRGGAKSWGFARALLLEGAARPVRILCCREVQKSLKDSVHNLLVDQIAALGLGGFYDTTANEIKGRNGTVFAFSGLSSLTAYSIKSYENFTYAWIEEAQTVSRKSLDILIPTIRANDSEIWLSLNPELDTDEVWNRFIVDPPESAKVVAINYDDNPWFPPVLEEERLHMLRQVEKGARDRDDYDNIWLGKTKIVIDGAIYAKELTELKRSGRLCRVPYDPMLKVHTIWDLGWADSMSILMVQKLGSEVRVIDYIEDTHRTIDDYLISSEGREDLDSRKYRWGTDFLPHDGRNRSVLSDKSAEDILRGLDREVEITPEVGVENGIKALRMLLPRMVIDEEKAGLLFNRLSRYKRKINQTTGEPGNPEHDENSHGSDGARYLAVVEDQLTNEDADIGDPYKGFR